MNSAERNRGLVSTEGPPSLPHGSAAGSPAPIDVAIVSDVRLLREGLADSLGRIPTIRVIGTVDPAADAGPRIVALRPHVTLVDVGTPGALQLVRTIRAAAPGSRIVAFAVIDTEETVMACAEAGVHGYICRDASVEEVVLSVERACRDELHCSPKIAASMFRRMATMADARDELPIAYPLTPREREIVAQIDRGLSNKEIARELGIELATVKNHVHNILAKLSASGRGDAAARVRASRESMFSDAMGITSSGRV